MEAETISRVSPYLLQGLLLTTAYCKQAGPQFLRILVSASYLKCWDYRGTAEPSFNWGLSF